MGFFTGWSIKHATIVTPVHKSLQLTPYTYADAGAPAQGYQVFVPDAAVECREICNGYDSRDFYITGAPRRKNSFLTVAINMEKPFFYRKGVDLLLEAAKELPHCLFTIIGKSPSVERLELPENVTLMPPVPYQELVHHYNAHEFYLQLSMAEGFPNALCEAMLCGCVPIGSNVFGIPDIIGETGYILMKKDKQQLVELIQSAVRNGAEAYASKASDRIRTEFPIEKREKEFVDVIDYLLAKKKVRT
ncbi:glycosyltransferase family 4 protein [Rufibacter quisquiliarum]|uniref:Glycosyltransferase involved in cell wall biosynthesis n=1 Tax=Rufibacter quisquiliarum TaxID=1549639 RepID=A0A839GL82_9BACT|nr:glycosyltransferase family 4 protein [Rufibacter quisquiliarum]MBA9079450.1 glycosyltransferase involved in cell wall biosynthesis [Rufibacter quisquiliarum]